VVLRILAAVKSVLPTGYVVAIIGQAGEAVPDVAAANARLLEGRTGKKKAAVPAAPAVAPVAPAAPAADPGLLRATPAARRLAREKGIDLARVKAENRAEVVTEEMVKRFIA
jgi:pyruvate dehydrogenase E2 component (dihydrolipoamide acetyltransferase)